MTASEFEILRDELVAIRVHTDGIPLLAKAIEVLQRDVRSLRDDVRVTSAMVQRVDGTLGNLWPELSAIHQWMIGVNNRLRKLEDES